MIKKLGLTLLLICIGFGVLHLTIGFENFARVHEETGSDSIVESVDAPRGVVVGGTTGDREAAVTAHISGAVEFQRRTEKILESGDKLLLPLYELTAKSSETLEDDLMRLDGVRVEFFEIEEDGPRPVAVLVGTLHAREALVQIGRNESGDPSIREDRDMDLVDVVLRTEPGAPVKDMQLTVERVLVRHSEEGLAFRTPDPSEPFHLELGGDEPMTLDGKGLNGTVPDRQSKVQTMELHVQSDPVLVHQRVSLSAQGSLDYTEDTRSGSGRVELKDEVVIDGLGHDSADRDDSTAARGDRLVAFLTRVENDQPDRSTKPEVAWRSLRLSGRPAVFETGTAELHCSVLTGAPSLEGKPYAFTAAGNPRLVDSETGARFEAERLIHLVQLPEMLGAIDRSLGMTHSWYGDLAQELVIFEGGSKIVDESRGITMTASNGLRLLRSTREHEPPVMVVADGNVQVTTEDLDLTSNLGFELRQDGARLRLRLGPDRAVAHHEFHIEQRSDSATVPSLVVDGHGLCEIEQTGEASFHVHLVAGDLDDIEVVRPEGSLTQIGELTADIVDKAFRSFDARGNECVMTQTLVSDAKPEGEKVEGRAPHIHSDDGQSFSLLGTADQFVRLSRGTDETIDGERVDIHRIDDEHAVLVAFGTAGGKRAHVVAKLAAPAAPSDPEASGERTRIDRVDLEATRVFFVPHHEIAPAWLEKHGVTALTAETLAEATAAGMLASRYVFATGDVDLTLFGVEDPDKPVGTATGASFYLREEDRSGTLRGPDASLAQREEGGRNVLGRARRIQFRMQDGDDLALTLFRDDEIDPVLELLDHGAKSDDPFRHVRTSCAGPIQSIGLTTQFLGPVHAQGLDELGAVDPDGLDLIADNMELIRDPKTGDLTTVTANGGPRLQYGRVLATGDEMSILIPKSQCDVKSHGGQARVDIGTISLLGSQFRVNYATQEVHAWRPRLLPPDRELGANDAVESVGRASSTR